MLNLAVILYYSINYTVVGGGRMFNDLQWLITCYYMVYTQLYISGCPSHCQFGKIRGVLIHKICSTVHTGIHLMCLTGTRVLYTKHKLRTSYTVR